MAIPKLKVWADAVKARDGKCVDCGTDEDLHAHHIKAKSSHPEISLDVSNGKTLCYRCHKAEHERNRPVRIRSNRPQRRTLQARIKGLEDALKTANLKIRELSHKVGVCERGSCQTAIKAFRSFP